MARPKNKPAETLHIVRRWESSPILYGFDSRFDRKENPAYHPPILLTHLGTFVDEAHKPIADKDVPDYVRADAKGANLDVEYHPPTRRNMTMTDAMLGAGVQDTDPDAAVRAKRAAASKLQRAFA